MKLLLITLILLGLGIAGLALKILTKKEGKFNGTCASQSPLFKNNGKACSMCGKTSEQLLSCEETQH